MVYDDGPKLGYSTDLDESKPGLLSNYAPTTLTWLREAWEGKRNYPQELQKAFTKISHDKQLDIKAKNIRSDKSNLANSLPTIFKSMGYKWDITSMTHKSNWNEQKIKETNLQRAEAIPWVAEHAEEITEAILEEWEKLSKTEKHSDREAEKESSDISGEDEEENSSVPPENNDQSYDREKFLEEVYMQEGQYEEIVETLERNKNIILQGPPGVGKTFAAKRLAWSMMGKKDKTRIEFVQFHQSYTYEDFVRGYKASGDGFELKDGIFYRFCQKARSCPDEKFFFIIDEINRGNLSKIFGELLMGVEKDHREESITLEYSEDNDPPFSVPKNLYIIGMMNTADRSLAMLDYALRRRFSFFDMGPAFQSAGFKKYCKGIDSRIGSKMFSNLIATIEKLNNEGISKSLGEEFCIGHSYFCSLGEKDEKELYKELHSIVKYDIIPTLKEYWFDDEDRFEYWKKELNKAVDESK